MKKLIIFTILLFSISLKAIVTDKEVEYMEENWYLKDPLEQIKPINFKTKNFDITTEIIKYNYVPSWQDEDLNYISAKIHINGYLNFNGTKKAFFYSNDILANYQAFEQIVCDKKDYINLIFVQIEENSARRFSEIWFSPYIYKISKENNTYNIKDITDKNKKILEYKNYTIVLNLSDSTPRYPYYNKEKIINRLIETGFCKQDEIVEGIAIDIKNNFEILPLDNLIKRIRNKDIKIDTYYIVNSFVKYPLENNTLQKYNDLAYYLQLSNKNKEAIFILEKIIEKFPNRTVAYLNLADAYNGLNNKDNAKQNYEKYIELMKLNNKKSKIPIRVFEHLNVFKSNETIREK